MTDSRYEERRSKKRSSEGLLKQAASLVSTIHALNDRQPAEHEQNPEVERRRHEDIRQALRGLAGVQKVVIDELSKYSSLEEDFVEIFKDEQGEEYDPYNLPRPANLSEYLISINVRMRRLTQWCKETERLWANTIPAIHHVAHGVTKNTKRIADAETGGGGESPPPDLGDLGDVTISSPEDGDYLCYDDGTGDFTNGKVTKAGETSPKRLNFPITPGDNDYACWDPTDTPGGAITLGPVTHIGGGAAGPAKVGFPTTPGSGDYMCYSPGDSEFQAGKVTHVGATTNSEIDFPTTPGADEFVGWSTGDGKFINKKATLDGLSDTTLTAPASGQFLRYDGSKWINQNNNIGTLGSLSDVTITGPSSGQRLEYNGSIWVNATVSPKMTVSAGAPSSPSAGDAWRRTSDYKDFIYNGTSWLSVHTMNVEYNRAGTFGSSTYLGFHRINVANGLQGWRAPFDVYVEKMTITTTTGSPSATCAIDIYDDAVSVYSLAYGSAQIKHAVPAITIAKDSVLHFRYVFSSLPGIDDPGAQVILREIV